MSKNTKQRLADVVWVTLSLGDDDGKPFDVARAKQRAEGMLRDAWWADAQRVFYSKERVRFTLLGVVTPKNLQRPATSKFKVGGGGGGYDQEEDGGLVQCFYFLCKKRKATDSSQIMVLGLIESDQLRKEGYVLTAKKLSRDHALGWSRYEGMTSRRERRMRMIAADCYAARRLFTFPVRNAAGPSLFLGTLGGGINVTREAIMRRCVTFVAEVMYDKTRSHRAIMDQWSQEALPSNASVPSDGLHPQVLQRPSQRALLQAYFVGATTAALFPDSPYAKARAEAEALYIKWLVQWGGYDRNEEHAIWLLERNGWQGLLTDGVTLDDLRLFKALHPNKPAPSFAGWLPFHMCPEEFFASGRPLSRGCIRFYYADIEEIVVRVMFLDHEYFQSTRQVVLEQNINPLVYEIPRLMDAERKAICERQKSAYQPLGNGKSGSTSGSSDWDLPIEDLVSISPPCIQNMLANAQRDKESLKDRQRFWLVRYLKGLGYGVADYDYLAKPLWLEARENKGLPTTDQAYRGDFDPSYGFKQDKCARAYCSGKDGIIEDTLSIRGKRICECPYARASGSVEGATAQCKATWQMLHPDKMRDNSKPLYYPQQHAYWNRRRGRAHIPIQYEFRDEED